MMLYTSAQADQIRGFWVNGHALAPRPIKVAATALLAGKFALPNVVLTDPAYVAIPALMALLQAGQSVLDSVVTLVSWDTDATVVANNTYRKSWPLGTPVAVGPSSV